jgi:mRNA interferase MazF
MNRGDVILVRFPHPSGVRGKKRPAVVIQSDAYSQSIRTIVVAEITTNLAMSADPACLFVDVRTSDGQATGLRQDSVVSCLLLATIDADKVSNKLGVLSNMMRNKLDNCVKAALGLL